MYKSLGVYSRFTSKFKTMNMNGLHIFDLKKKTRTISRINRQFRIFFSMSNYMLNKYIKKKLQRSNYEM